VPIQIKICPMATPRTTDRTGTLEESVYERIENAGEGDKEGRSRKNR